MLAQSEYRECAHGDGVMAVRRAKSGRIDMIASAFFRLSGRLQPPERALEPLKAKTP